MKVYPRKHVSKGYILLQVKQAKTITRWHRTRRPSRDGTAHVKTIFEYGTCTQRTEKKKKMEHHALPNQVRKLGELQERNV